MRSIARSPRARGPARERSRRSLQPAGPVRVPSGTRARLLDKEIDQTTLSCLVNFRQRADEEWFAERNPARHALGGNQTDKR